MATKIPMGSKFICPKCQKLMAQTNENVVIDAADMFYDTYVNLGFKFKPTDYVHYNIYLCTDCGAKIDLFEQLKELAEHFDLPEPRPIVRFGARDEGGFFGRVRKENT